MDVKNLTGFADAGNSRTANGLYFHSECNRFYAGENRNNPLLKLSVAKMLRRFEFTLYSKQQQRVAAGRAVRGSARGPLAWRLPSERVGQRPEDLHQHEADPGGG